MPKPDPYLVAIDIGSMKVGVLMGQLDEEGRIEVVGKGRAPNRGTRKGNIVNVEATVEALKQANEEAEVMAGTEISRAWPCAPWASCPSPPIASRNPGRRTPG